MGYMKGYKKDEMITGDPLSDLATAVVMQSIDDWKHAKLYLDKHSASKSIPVQRECNLHRRTVSEVERFFKSQWFFALTEIDGEELWERINRTDAYKTMKVLNYK